MKLLLTAVSGSRQGKTFTVEANECVSFGRTDASTWSFEDDGHMSGIHFEVENLGEHCEVRDRGSTNGTWLNSEKIERTRLREGDRIRAGLTVLTVEFIQSVIPSASSDALGRDTGVQDNPLDDVAPESLPPLPTSPPPLGPLPSTERINTPRPVNPFDSIDFASNAAFREDQIGPAPATPSSTSDSPFSDSSISFPSPAQQENVAAQNDPHSHHWLHRQTTQDAADSIAIILDSLAKKWSIQLVLHFQKVRTIPPLPPQVMQPLFAWLSDTEAAAYSPIRIAWNDAVSGDTVLPLLPRLCRSDGCLAFLGRSADEVGPQIDRMLNVGVEGFSEQDGFLPTCWPSSLAAIIDNAGINVCENLFGGKIAGALMCSAANRTKIMAIADAHLAEDLRATEFVPADRIRSG